MCTCVRSIRYFLDKVFHLYHERAKVSPKIHCVACLNLWRKLVGIKSHICLIYRWIHFMGILSYRAINTFLLNDSFAMSYTHTFLLNQMNKGTSTHWCLFFVIIPEEFLRSEYHAFVRFLFNFTFFEVSTGNTIKKYLKHFLWDCSLQNKVTHVSRTFSYNFLI